MKIYSPEITALYATRQFMTVDLLTFSGGNLGPGTTTTIVLTSGAAFVVPNDWNSANNLVFGLAGGGGGGRGNGGGGGAYSATPNVLLTPGATISYSIGGAGSAGSDDGVTPAGGGGDTWFGGSSYGTSLIGAKAGAGAGDGFSGAHVGPPGAGGAASGGRGAVTISGQAGSGVTGSAPGSGGAGGIAGGASVYSGSGGTGGAGQTFPTIGVTGGNGGNYGGGGGGGGQTWLGGPDGGGGAGAQGAIVIQYTTNEAVIRFCTGDADVVANGFRFYAGRSTGPFWDRHDNKAKCHWKVGTEVDSLSIDCLPGSFQLFGIPLQQAAKLGYFDGAQVLLEKCPMPWGAYGDTRRGTIRYFSGRVAEIQQGRSRMSFQINSHLELLNLQLPRNLYQQSCVNNLGDAACGVNLSTFSVSGVVAAGSTQQVINTNSSPYTSDPTNAFGHGKIVFTSGVNRGLAGTITMNVPGSPGQINLLAPLPRAPSAGDTFIGYLGCDKTLYDGNPQGATADGSNVISGLTDPSQYQPGQMASINGLLAVVFGIGPSSVTVSQNIPAGSVTFSPAINGCPKFANQARFRAERLVPQPGVAL